MGERVIPVLVCPVLNGPERTRAMLASVNVPVERTILIDNSAEGTAVEDDPRYIVVRPHHNLGVAASWNLGIKMTPLAPWWCIVANDIVLHPDDLPSLVGYMASHPDGMAFLHEMSSFGISPAVIERVGWFDEGLHPAYFEDNDYVYRMQVAGVEYGSLEGRYEHNASATIRSDRRFWAENSRTFPRNESYYKAKWGGLPGHETFRTPFDAGGDIRQTSCSIDWLRSQTWKL